MCARIRSVTINPHSNPVSAQVGPQEPEEEDTCIRTQVRMTAGGLPSKGAPLLQASALGYRIRPRQSDDDHRWGGEVSSRSTDGVVCRDCLEPRLAPHMYMWGIHPHTHSTITPQNTKKTGARPSPPHHRRATWGQSRSGIPPPLRLFPGPPAHAPFLLLL